MLIELTDIEPLRNFFDIIYDSVNTVEMKLYPEKLSISLLNDSHVAFYNLEISKDYFLDYKIDDTESVLVFVEDFYNILKSSKNDIMLTLESTESNLICTFEGQNSRRIFELPLAEDYNDVAVPPSIDYDCVFNLSINGLKQSVDDLVNIVKTDRFRMALNDGSLNIVAPNDSLTRYNQSFEIDSEGYGNVTVDIKYIKDILKLSKINKIVELKIGDDMPVTWTVSSVDGLVTASGLIAPIIEQEE